VGFGWLVYRRGLVWLAFADESIALPTNSKELALSLTDLQWTNNAFSLV
jgi:hypothetical protein